MGHTKRRRINHNFYCYSICIYPHLQAIGVECAVRVFPTPEEGDPRPKLPKSRHKKIAVAAFVEHMALEKTFQSSLLCRIDRFWADTANTDIHNLAYLQNHPQRPAFHPTPTQSRKIVSRPVNIKDFRFLGVGTRSQRSFKLHGLQITWVPSWTDISFSRSPR